MNKQTLIILGGGFCVALLVALLLQMVMGTKEEPAPVTAVKAPTEILVAAKDLGLGEEIKSSSYEWKEWPENALFEGAIVKEKLSESDRNKPVEGRLRRAVSKGEPLIKTALVEDDKGNFVAATLSPGARAMAIRVKAESSVGGFLTPNDHVDVILTYEVRLPSDDRVRDASVAVVSKKAAQTVLENVRVVAVDQKAKEVEKVSVARTVTLEVTPKQAEKLALAESMGSLSLALRGTGDEASIFVGDNKTVSTTDTRISNVLQELLGDENNSGVQGRVVRVYNGATPSEMVVRPYVAQ